MLVSFQKLSHHSCIRDYLMNDNWFHGCVVDERDVVRSCSLPTLNHGRRHMSLVVCEGRQPLKFGIISSR